MKNPIDKQLKARGDLLKQFGAGYGFRRESAEPEEKERDPAETLEKLRKRIGNCKRCELCETRKNIVFGVGDPGARILFVGEGPGEEEDNQGEPFVGRAGQLLTKIITGGMGLRREDVYIANIVKCRPPENRNPKPAEAIECLPFLKAQIAAVNPEVIICLGKIAVLYLLQRAEPIGQLRGRWTSYNDIPVMPTFHPSYLLRNPAAKAEVWEDIQEVLKKLGIPIPSKK
ncbi:MAG TPA: uracil-DNA glycosylase [Acidobacteriota bacterium]|nr:uracil-DNA glycosylase [Acidobacteriota bacterium]HNT18025.1 uracil-DNA glycosylase [Acidobacteriota bacterium]HPA26833.1 uracil-DNA glycosylase [Acidobacteriota bacterium]HQO19498.1 uracil-DNA glycosylase [Acidobacteriota bacterium]HQQ45972.1 uracil-DNA glycosylase [Acidobacteriota bacterium]